MDIQVGQEWLSKNEGIPNPRRVDCIKDDFVWTTFGGPNAEERSSPYKWPRKEFLDNFTLKGETPMKIVPAVGQIWRTESSEEFRIVALEGNSWSWEYVDPKFARSVGRVGPQMVKNLKFNSTTNFIFVSEGKPEPEINAKCTYCKGELINVSEGAELPKDSCWIKDYYANGKTVRRCKVERITHWGDHKTEELLPLPVSKHNFSDPYCVHYLYNREPMCSACGVLKSNMRMIADNKQNCVPRPNWRKEYEQEIAAMVANSDLVKAQQKKPAISPYPTIPGIGTGFVNIIKIR